MVGADIAKVARNWLSNALGASERGQIISWIGTSF
jgi:hypothetical protein